MKVFFTAWLLINGAWTHGSFVHGWWPIDMGSETVCQNALGYAMENSTTDTVRFSCETLEDTRKYIKDSWR